MFERRRFCLGQSIQLDVCREQVCRLAGELKAQDMGFGQSKAQGGLGRVGLAGCRQRCDGAIDEAVDAARIVAVAGFGDEQEAEAKAGGLQGRAVVTDQWIAQNGLVAPDGFDQFALLFQALRFGQILNQTKNLPLPKAAELIPECRTSYWRTSLFLARQR
ncbi:hypothetical protein [Devosia riboflavina]|nr:hypothetical protein [Devosia riboflavina]